MKNNKMKVIIMMIVILFVVLINLIISQLTNNKEGSEVNLEKVKEVTFVSHRTDKERELKELIRKFEYENESENVKVKLELIGDPQEILQRRALVQELSDVTLVPEAINANEYDKYFLEINDLGFTEKDIYNYQTGIGKNGNLYSLNTSINWPGIIYNKKIFKELGIKELPNNLEEFLKICEIIKKENITPIIINYKLSWTMNKWIDTVPYLFQKNLDEYVILEGNDILSESSGMYKSFNFIRRIFENKYCEEDLLNYQWENSKIDLKSGKAAMIFFNSEFIYQLEDVGMNKEDLGMFPIPESEFIAINGDYKIAISKETKYPEISKRFLKYLFENDNYSKAVGISSPLKNEENKRFIEDLNKFDIEIEFTGEKKEESKEEANIHEIFKSINNVSNLNFELLQEYVINEDNEELIDNVNLEWEKNLKEIYK